MTALFSTLKPQVPETLEPADRWQQRGACRETDPEIFFPVGEGPDAQQQTDDAKKICGTCPVKDICRDWAIDTRQVHGVWGGMTAKERHNLRRREARATASDNELQELAAALLNEHSVPVGDHREWRGPISIRIKGVATTAKRIAWIHEHGARPDAALIVACGHPKCILPAHMQLQSAGVPAELTEEEAADYRAGVYTSRSVDVGDGHREWQSSEPVTVLGASYTARQLAWTVTHGERPAGVMKVMCGHPKCISPAHLRDRGATAHAA
ncbi:WhiB family transcriptional regulator [Streptomyces sp. NPDC006296]|uniref:WhiB family transcriptional regulator n=1 Tax=Streptomyces sp. NPDC006296 TaxID=3156746 RepID=UPI0033A9AB33